MYSRLMRNWEIRLATESSERHTPLPFRVGGDWFRDEFPDLVRGDDDLDGLIEAASRALAEPAGFYHPSPPRIPFEHHRGVVRFPSRGVTGEASNRTVYMTYRPLAEGCPMVVALPPWNTQRWKLKTLLPTARQSGFGGASLSLPYQDERMPGGWDYAQGLISSDLGLTLRAIQQSVMDAMDALTVLRQLGHERVVFVGFSIGSGIVNLLDAHDERDFGVICVLCGDSFAKCVYNGISTRHIRRAFDKRGLPLEQIDRVWQPLSAEAHVHRLVDRPRPVRAMLTSQYDFTFPTENGRGLRALFEKHGVEHEWLDMPCGHYTLSCAPFSLRVVYWLRGLLQSALLAAPEAGAAMTGDRAEEAAKPPRSSTASTRARHASLSNGAIQPPSAARDERASTVGGNGFVGPAAVPTPASASLH